MANKPADRNAEAKKETTKNVYKVVDMSDYHPLTKRMEIVGDHVRELIKAGKGKGIIVLSVEVPSRSTGARDAHTWRSRYAYVAKRLGINLSLTWVENENGTYNPLISLK